MKRWLGVVPVVFLAFGLVACDGSPTDSSEAAFDDDVEFFLAEAGASSTASPAERATAAVAHARALLDRATQFVGAEPSAEVSLILTLAGEACDEADRALQAERWRAAAQRALRCAQGARMAALQARIERVEEAEARAAAAIERATELVAEAAALVTETSPPRAADVLAEAKGHLAEASRALEAHRFRAAIARAIRAGTLAQRIIQALG